MLTTPRGRLLPVIVLAAWSCLTAVHAAVLTPLPAGVSPQDPPESQEPKKGKPADQRVTGTVVDRDGEPIDGAEVRFDGPKRATVHTNSRGQFEFAGPPGDYGITVRVGERSQSFARKIEGGQLKPSGTLVIELDEPQQ
jgi:Carboxypeptidase regulatory-like domain